MSNEIQQIFQNDKEVLKTFTKEMIEYNKVLEDVIITAINTIHTKFIGKDINKRFTNAVNDILAKKYGTYENGNGDVSISVENSTFSTDDDKSISISINLPKYNYRYDIKRVLCVYNKFYRNQYRQEATPDNKFNEASINSLVELINVNRERVARYQDAVKNFDKYLKAVKKLQEEVKEKLGKINPMFYDYKMDTNTFNTPNYKEFEQKMKEQGGTYVFVPQEVEQ